MKKYNSIQIIDTEGKLVYSGSYTRLLNQFNNKEECDEYIENCKEKGYDYSTRTTYYDFEYNNEGLSENWLEDICSKIVYENSREMIEEIVLKSFKALNNIKCDYIGNKYMLIVLPRKYDSIILYRPNDYDYKFFSKLLREIHHNINGRHNKTSNPKIRIIEFVNDWRNKIKYADYNEGYTFYYNSIPQENKLNFLLK